MIRELAMAAAALGFISLAGAQMLYKSVGPDGKVTYNDRPPTEGTITKTMRVEDLPNTALPPKPTGREPSSKREASAGSRLLLAKGQQVRGFRASTYEALFASR